MNQTNRTMASVEVMWRPGCPFCGSLRRGLQRAGVETVEHDIWSSPKAAARVRGATGGDEIVPTVFVGERSLVNPSVRQVVAAIRAADPESHPADPVEGRRGWAATNPGLLWSVVVAVAWAALVLWRPTTTWHLAPMILAAAWPWVVGQDTSPGDAAARRRIGLAGAGGLGIALATTGALSLTVGLDGPTWTGSGSPVVEAALLALTGGALATTVGVLRTTRRAMSASARLGESLVVRSDDVVMVEANAYFPLTSVPAGVLHPSRTTTLCPWKGVASYYDVHVDGQVVSDAAFTYRHPSPLARRIKGRVAFWKAIDVDATPTLD